MSRSRATAALLAAMLALSAPAAAQRSDISVEEQYELGLRYMKRGYYVKALDQFNLIRNFHRDDPYAVKAELAIADLHFEKQEWDQARVAYEDFLRLHPRHEDIDYVVYRLGLVAYKKAPMIASRDQTWTRQAVNTWTGFDTRFAESEHLQEVSDNLIRARDRLARKEFVIGEFYFQRDAWVAVVGRMEGMLRQYPDATDAPMALAMLAIAKWELDEQEAAKQAIQRFREDYPLGELPEPVEPAPLEATETLSGQDLREARREQRSSHRAAKRRHRNKSRNVRRARILVLRKAPALAQAVGLEADPAPSE